LILRARRARKIKGFRKIGEGIGQGKNPFFRSVALCAALLKKWVFALT